MKTNPKNKAVQQSILLIALASFIQPYIVLFMHFGPSNECWNCLIIEQTFNDSLLYLLLPLTIIYFTFKKLGLNPWLQGMVIVLYYVPVSFVKITVPLFDDRIASWSTFSDQEIWDSAIFMAIPSMGVLAFSMMTLLLKINKETLNKIQTNSNDGKPNPKG